MFPSIASAEAAPGDDGPEISESGSETEEVEGDVAPAEAAPKRKRRLKKRKVIATGFVATTACCDAVNVAFL